MVKVLLSQCQDGVLRFKYISNEDVRALKEVLETLTYESLKSTVFNGKKDSHEN